MIQIYTGAGKGKTTAALGLALRALGHKKRVLLIQFMKQDRDSGEIKAARKFKRLEVLQTGKKGLVPRGRVTSGDKQAAQKGLRAAREAIKGRKYYLIILDELNVAVEFGLLNAREVKEILESTPKTQEVVVTGRYAHPEIIKIADLVSEIRELKHYYKNGITARMGIEY